MATDYPPGEPWFEPTDPRCPFCHRQFSDAERGQQEFTPSHPSRNRLLAARGQACRGSGEPLSY